MEVQWHSELRRRRAPPLQRFAFSPPTVLHICDSLWVGLGNLWFLQVNNQYESVYAFLFLWTFWS
jgi:hypothetical protein